MTNNFKIELMIAGGKVKKDVPVNSIFNLISKFSSSFMKGSHRKVHNGHNLSIKNQASLPKDLIISAIHTFEISLLTPG
jgi:hypothetical protein